MPGRERHDRVVAVVVTHTGPSDALRACLVSLDRTADIEVIVVDNGSHGDLDAEAYGPSVTSIVRTENRGFGAAVNCGIGHIDRSNLPPPHVMVLNDDVELRCGWLGPLRAALDADPALGAVQPKLLLAGTDPPLINSVGVAVDRSGACADVGHGEPDDGRFDAQTEIEAFTGGAVLLRDQFVAEIGPFDEHYFLYYEDVDLAARGAARGWRYACVPSSTVVHHMSTSTAELGSQVVYLRERNRLWTCVRFRDPTTIARAYWLAARRLRHEPRRAHRRALAASIGALPRLLWSRFRERRS